MFNSVYSNLSFTVDNSFIEVDSQILSQKVDEWLSIKAQQDSYDALCGTSGSKTGELEAIFWAFQSVKSIAIENIMRCKESANLQLVELCEKEETEKAAKQLEEERQEAERREAERHEVEHWHIGGSCTFYSSWAWTNSTNWAIDTTSGGRRGCCWRGRDWWARVRTSLLLESGKTYAAALEQYVLALRQLSNYMLQELKTKRANCRTAMLSNDDAITGIIHHEQTGIWHGPGIPLPSTNLPDFYKEVEHVEAEM